ncbi:hypothetical protein [Cupriavidus necator]|uniref:hypothetical protein n=1 Tax=Cupriavidus necator TaxID=106590 RepID=UPI0005B483EA|nr:hypothetical protein [Cupriavidus necator]
MKRTWKAWTEADDALLRQHWQTDAPVKDIAREFPGRSPAAVQKHAIDIGLPARGNVRRPKYYPVWEGIKLELAKGRMLSADELARRLKVTPRAVLKNLTLRHGTAVRVAGYGPVVTRAPAPRLWRLGSGPDAPPPTRKSKREVNRDYNRRMRKDPEFCLRDEQTRRLRYAEKTGKLIRRDPAAAWF